MGVGSVCGDFVSSPQRFFRNLRRWPSRPRWKFASVSFHAVLEAWLQQSGGIQSPEDIVFTSPITGRKFDTISKGWRQLRASAGLEDFRLHDLLHTFASKLVMAGVDPYAVKELLGHSTIQMPERYMHLASEYKAEAIERLVASL